MYCLAGSTILLVVVLTCESFEVAAINVESTNSLEYPIEQHPVPMVEVPDDDELIDDSAIIASLDK